MTRLRLETEVVQATADELPLGVESGNNRELWPTPSNLLRRHLDAFHNYTTALTCVQALLRQHGSDDT